MSAEIIEAAFRAVTERVRFLEDLAECGRKSEALTLCCVYIEGLGCWRYGDDKGSSRETFVKVLGEHGRVELLGLIDPSILARCLTGVKGCSEIAEKVCSRYSGSPIQLLTKNDLLADLRSTLEPFEVEKVQNEAWRGSVAAQLYSHVRNPAIHAFSGPDGIVFSDREFRGERIIFVGFRELYEALQNVASGVFDVISESTSARLDAQK